MKLILLLIVIAALVGAGIYYRGPIQQELAGTPSSPSPLADYIVPTPTPTTTPTPVPTATPTPTPTQSPLTSIANLNNPNLPKAGPDLNLALAGGTVVLTSGGAYYWRVKRSLHKALKNIDIR